MLEGIMTVLVVVAAVLFLLLAWASAVVVQEWDRGVVFTLGRYAGIRRPGLRFIIPVLQQMELVDIRERVVDVPPQEIITKDNVLVTVNGVIYYRITDPRMSLVDVEDIEASTREMAQSTLREVSAGFDLDDLGDPEKAARMIRGRMEEKTQKWGVIVPNVEIKDIRVDPKMRALISRQAEADRERKAVIIEANAQEMSAQSLANAATILGCTPLQLRYLQTLNAIGSEPSNTIVFPFPTSLADMIGGKGLPDDVKTALSSVATSLLAKDNPQLEQQLQEDQEEDPV